MQGTNIHRAGRSSASIAQSSELSEISHKGHDIPLHTLTHPPRPCRRTCQPHSFVGYCPIIIIMHAPSTYLKTYAIDLPNMLLHT